MVTRRKKASAGLRVVLYVRISSDPGGLEKGVDRQEADCRALAKSLGWTVVRVFRENDTSAYKSYSVQFLLGAHQMVRRAVGAVPSFVAAAHLDLVWAVDGGVADTARGSGHCRTNRPMP